jgi:hypothetical protein|tara:strand:- start:841 stop:1383 length:543 start_codon:yes stop_codon:yes gene_type:complete
MNSNTITGIFFLVGGVTPLLFYMALSPDGLDVLTTQQTELIASWLLLSIPIAYMRTTNTMTAGMGKEMAQIGVLVTIVAAAGGMVADSFGAAGDEATRNSIGQLLWSTMMIGTFFMGLGYYLEKAFPVVISGLLMLLGVVGFLVLGIGGADADENSVLMVVMPIWILLIIAMGVITLRRK